MSAIEIADYVQAAGRVEFDGSGNPFFNGIGIAKVERIVSGLGQGYYLITPEEDIDDARTQITCQAESQANLSTPRYQSAGAAVATIVDPLTGRIQYAVQTNLNGVPDNGVRFTVTINRIQVRK
jgi:hypothetical protein